MVGTLSDWIASLYILASLLLPAACLGAFLVFAISDGAWQRTHWGRGLRLCSAILATLVGGHFLYNQAYVDAEVIFLYVFWAAPAGLALLGLSLFGYRQYGSIERVFYAVAAVIAVGILVFPFLFMSYRACGKLAGKWNPDCSGFAPTIEDMVRFNRFENKDAIYQ